MSLILPLQLTTVRLSFHTLAHSNPILSKKQSFFLFSTVINHTHSKRWHFCDRRSLPTVLRNYLYRRERLLSRRRQGRQWQEHLFLLGSDLLRDDSCHCLQPERCGDLYGGCLLCSGSCRYYRFVNLALR